MAASLVSRLAIKPRIRDIIVKEGGNIIKVEVNIIEEVEYKFTIKLVDGVEVEAEEHVVKLKRSSRLEVVEDSIKRMNYHVYHF